MFMAERAILEPAEAPLTIAFMVLAQASILEVASALDPLRNANRQLGHAAFRWRIVSSDGEAVPLTCDLLLPSSGTLADAVGAEMLMLIAGYRLDAVVTSRLVHDLRRVAPRFAMVGGIDAAPHVMARAGLLSGHRATVHWEDVEDLAAAHPDIDVVAERFVIDRNRVTIAGAAPAADFMLHLIERRHGALLARQVANSFLTERRSGSEPQLAAPLARAGGLDSRVAAAVARMEARLDAPEPVAETARAVGLSPRRLEMLFRQSFDTTPAAYALTLRLQAARRLLVDTRHPLAEVALRTGFATPSTLSRAFRRTYGHPPGALRRRPLAPFP